MMRRAPALAIGLTAAARTAAGWWMGFRPFDDTFITFRYSLNLASGNGFVYNVGEPVLGTTTPLWALLLAVFASAGVSIEHASLGLSLACDVASAFLLFRLLAALGFGRGIPVAGAVLFLGIFDYFSLARSGMESSFFVFLVLGSITAIASQRMKAAAVCVSCAVLTRPEGVLLLGLLPAAVWYHRAHLRRGDAAAAMTLSLVILGSWTIYALREFGSVVPQSVAAKAARASDPALAEFSWNNVGLFLMKGQYGGEIFTRTYLQLMPVLSLLAALGALCLAAEVVRGGRGDAIPRAVLLLFFPAAYGIGMSLSHAFTYFPWYYAPIYPFLAALAPIGAAFITRSSSTAVIGVACALVAAQLAAAAAVKLPADSSAWVEGYFAVSKDVPRDAGVSVAAPEIGAVGWRTWPSTILDLEGLVTPAAVGTTPEEFFRLNQPAYLVLRTDNGAQLLQALQQDAWFERTYVAISVHADRKGNREFRTYRKKP